MIGSVNHSAKITADDQHHGQARIVTPQSDIDWSKNDSKFFLGNADPKAAVTSPCD
jgi:hypothetical protein